MRARERERLRKKAPPELRASFSEAALPLGPFPTLERLTNSQYTTDSIDKNLSPTVMTKITCKLSKLGTPHQ